MIYRAYAPLTLKTINAEQRQLAGVATSPQPDRVGDVIESKGAQFANPLPLLLYHDAERPVGDVRLEKATADGIRFEAKIADVPEPGPLRDRVNEAWQSVKAGLIRGVSIGFRVLDDGIELLKSGGVRFTSIEILELSLVAIPANQRATIDTIKSFAVPSRRIPDPAVPATRDTAPRKIPIMEATKLQQRRRALETERDAKAAAMNALCDAQPDSGATMDETKQQQFDELKSDHAAIVAELERLDVLEQINKAAAVPPTSPTPARVTAPVLPVVHLRGAGDGGILAPYAICLLNAFMSRGRESALDVARRMYPQHQQLADLVDKAAVPAATTGSAPWAGALLAPPVVVQELIQLIQPKTIIFQFGMGGIPPLLNVPFNARINGETSGGTGYWVAEGKPKPLTSFAFDMQTLGWLKVAAMAVLTQETIRFSGGAAEERVRAGLSDALAKRLNIDFIDPGHAGAANVSPASITNGVTPITSSGTTADNVRKDVQALVQAYLAAGNDPDRLVLIMPSTLALNLSMMTNALGQSEFGSGITRQGGTLLGLPVIASQYAAFAAPPTSVGNLVVAVDSSRVALAADPTVSIDASDQASLEMSDAPTQNGATGTGAALVSLWQNNMIGLRAEQFINWAKLRPGAVQMIEDVKWGA